MVCSLQIQGVCSSSGALAFHRDMFLNVSLVIDLLKVRQRRQLSVDSNLERVNAKRSSYDYRVGDTVLKKRHEWSKLGERWDGPFTICCVHVNGNVTIPARRRFGTLEHSPCQTLPLSDGSPAG